MRYGKRSIAALELPSMEKPTEKRSWLILLSSSVQMTFNNRAAKYYALARVRLSALFSCEFSINAHSGATGLTSTVAP